MIRPQIQKQKNERDFQEKLTKGSYIVTNTGIHGKIIEIKNNFIILEIITGKIKIEKNTISKELTKLHYNNKIKNKVEINSSRNNR
ncbi:preprotein translocase subunit YajC [Blattabacterium cuenoti]|uniref:preprotein translocase subunit YajC n=1 Tax=Blattabacterium cuenoti TaxID=1653831 RepID=UPI00293BFD04|nr:preprotein translocase subunit YajC [Blattabacterium cuenoti]